MDGCSGSSAGDASTVAPAPAGRLNAAAHRCGSIGAPAALLRRSAPEREEKDVRRGERLRSVRLLVWLVPRLAARSERERRRRRQEQAVAGSPANQSAQEGLWAWPGRECGRGWEGVWEGLGGAWRRGERGCDAASGMKLFLDRGASGRTRFCLGPMARVSEPAAHRWATWSS